MEATAETQKLETRTYTLKQAADILGYPKSTAYDLVRRGQFPVPVIRGARTIRVSKQAIERLLDPERGRAA